MDDDSWEYPHDLGNPQSGKLGENWEKMAKTINNGDLNSFRAEKMGHAWAFHRKKSVEH